MLENQKDYVISILEKICLERNYTYKINDNFFIFEIDDFKREKRLYHRFIISIFEINGDNKIILKHKGFSDFPIVMDLMFDLNIDSLLPFFCQKMMDNIILHRKKEIELRDLEQNINLFNKDLIDPIYIRDLKLNNFFNNFS
jgi:hypothetical protein